MREEQASDGLAAARRLVVLEQLRAHYAQIPAMALAPSAGGLFAAWVLWDAVDRRWLVIGMSAVLVLSALRLLLYRHFFSLPPERAGQARWRWIAVAAAGVSGCIWGSAAPLLYPLRVAGHETFLVVLLTMLPVVPVAALAAYPPALYAYSLPCIAPFVMTLALQGSRAERMAALLLVMMLGAMLAFARRYSRSLGEAVELRETLAQRSRALQDAVRHKSQFIAAAAHDLRQPVQAMGLFMASLREHRSGADDEAFIAHLDASLHNLRGMLGNMLDISKLDAEAVGPRRDDFAVDSLLRTLADEHAPLAAQKGLSLRVRLRPAVVHSDAMLIERIVRNLLSNALKYTERGGVALLCRTQGADVRVQVFDTGIGIAAGELTTAFEEFRQLGGDAARAAAGADSGAGGLGLGLAIVRRLTGLLGHTLQVRSVPGRGTTFTLVLPRGAAADVPAVPLRRDTPPLLTSLPTPPAHVMIIDDDAAVRASASALLRQWGHHTSECASAAQALALLDRAGQTPPQVLVVDLCLAAGESGLDAVARVLQRVGQTLPVILISADTAPERIREAHAAGHVLLHKPVDPLRLRWCLAEVCRPGPQG